MPLRRTPSRLHPSWSGHCRFSRRRRPPVAPPWPRSSGFVGARHALSSIPAEVTAFVLGGQAPSFGRENVVQLGGTAPLAAQPPKQALLAVLGEVGDALLLGDPARVTDAQTQPPVHSASVFLDPSAARNVHWSSQPAGSMWAFQSNVSVSYMALVMVLLLTTRLLTFPPAVPFRTQ